MKRFWTRAEAVRFDAGWGVSLDGKPVRLPGGAMLAVPFPALAEAIATEWRGAGLDGETVKVLALPLTGLAGTALQIAADPAPTIQALVRYADSDVLCYRAPDSDLAACQAEMWQPWLDWAETVLRAPLRITTGIMPIAQSVASRSALQQAVETLSVWSLASLSVAVPALGSLVLGLALTGFKLQPDEACCLATLDEDHQAQRWGNDSDAVQRRAKILQDVSSSTQFLQLTSELTTI